MHRRHLAADALRVAAQHAGGVGGHAAREPRTWAPAALASKDLRNHLLAPVRRAGHAAAATIGTGWRRNRVKLLLAEARQVWAAFRDEYPASAWTQRAARAGYLHDAAGMVKTVDTGVGVLELAILDFGAPEVAVLFGEPHLQLQVVIRPTSALPSAVGIVDNEGPGVATTNADFAALHVMQAVVWPAVRAAFGADLAPELESMHARFANEVRRAAAGGGRRVPAPDASHAFIFPV